MSLFHRSIKLVLAAGGSLLLADWFGLNYASFASIIAILSLVDSRRSTLKIVLQRFYAFVLAMLIGGFSLAAVGFNDWGLLVYMLCYFPLAHYFGVMAGIAPASVTVFHLHQEGAITWQILNNEFWLFAIGAGLALLVNLYMPSKEKKISAYHQQVEDKLREIMLRFEELLVSGDGTNQAKLITELDALLEKALATVYLDKDNQVFNRTNYHVHYFEMRQAQNNILRNMARLMNQLDSQSPEGVLLAQLFAETAEELSETNSGEELLSGIGEFLATFRKRELPKTREEFENRALLFQLLNDMQHLLQIKLDFYRHYYKENESQL